MDATRREFLKEGASYAAAATVLRGLPASAAPAQRPNILLFDLAEDPLEDVNRAADLPAVVNRLRELLPQRELGT